MDHRRLDSFSVMAAGIPFLPAPETEVPRDRPRFDASDSATGSYLGPEAVGEALLRGEVVEASNYYGVVLAWRADDGRFRGTLLQYRAITDDPVFATAAECADWFSGTYRATE